MGASFLKHEWLIPPGLPLWQRRAAARIRQAAPKDKDVLWVFSSGTRAVDRMKCVGLSFDAVLESARTVNSHLLVTKRDRWALVIPTYHVGGYAVRVRARLSGSKVFKMGKWNPKKFVRWARENRVTLAAMVPTQVFDLVTEGLRCPRSLRAIVVGGGALDENLYLRARELGWPLLPSYGLTETASQIATAGLESLKTTEFPGLTVLPHVQLKIERQQIFIQSLSLCRWIATADGDGLFTLEDPLRRGWFPTEDLAEWKGAQVAGRPQMIRVLGRRDDVVKVFGVLVSLPQVESDVREFARSHGVDLGGDLTVVAVDGGREGARVVLVVGSVDGGMGDVDLDGLVKGYNASVNGPFRIQEVRAVKAIPRTSLGKVRRAELVAML